MHDARQKSSYKGTGAFQYEWAETRRMARGTPEIHLGMDTQTSRFPFERAYHAVAGGSGIMVLPI